MTENGMNAPWHVQYNVSLTFHIVFGPTGEYLNISFAFFGISLPFLTLYAFVMTDIGMYTCLHDEYTIPLTFYIVSGSIGELLNTLSIFYY